MRTISRHSRGNRQRQRRIILHSQIIRRRLHGLLDYIDLQQYQLPFIQVRLTNVVDRNHADNDNRNDDNDQYTILIPGIGQRIMYYVASSTTTTSNECE
jgi:hypothetical protein